MGEFDATYLRCSAAGYGPDDLFFSSGPEQIEEPFSSVSVGSIVEYRTEEMATALAALPGYVNVRNETYRQAWRWERGGRYIEVSVDGDNTDDSGVWLASTLSVDCTFAELVTVWSGLRRTHPAVYLHEPSCRMFTPRSFLEEPALHALGGALVADDEVVREETAGVYRIYRALAGAPRRWKAYWRERTPGMAASVFDLRYPVAPVACQDIWRGRDWESRAAAFDAELSNRGLCYFAYPTGDWVGGKFKSGFMSWCPQEDRDAVRGVASSLGILSDRQP